MHVVVVGGGIVGVASAHYLRERGAEVTLCEQSALGSGSTERAVGGIRAQFSTPINVALSQASLDVWADFEETFDTEIAYRQCGYLFCAREGQTADRFREQVAMQQGLGVDSEYLDPDAATEYCPELHADRFVGATYCPTDGFADPHLALRGFATAAREAGVDIRTHTPVTDVLRDGDGVVTGVETDDGTIEADVVVNAAGPWARRVAAMADIEMPVAPRRRQVTVVGPEIPMAESLPLVIDLDTGVYFRPEREGRAFVGGQFTADDPDADPDRFDTDADTDWSVTAVEHAADVAGYFGPETRIRRGWAGLYAVTPDHHPIIEESVPGFVQAVGFSGHGFQHAPATGQLVAELCLDGEASLVDIESLSSQRFVEGGGHDEFNVA